MSVIIAPIDFSVTTPPVIKTATYLASISKTPLILCHVVEPIPQFVSGDASFTPVQIPVPQDTAHFAQQLEEWEKKAKETYSETSSRLLTGLAVEEVLSLAKLLSASFLVLGSHGHGALYNLFVGSVVTGILKRAPLPVVVVPAARNIEKQGKVENV